MMFSKSTPAVLATLFFGLILGGSAFACSLDGWDDDSGVVIGSPFDADTGAGDVNGLWRYEQLCAMRATVSGARGPSGPYVLVNSALSHSEVWNRFYVLLDSDNFTGSGDAPILVGYSDDGATTELFNFSYDGTDLNINTPGTDGSVPGIGDGWHVIEYHVDFSSDTIEVWVNQSAVDNPESPDASVSPITTVRGPATLEAIKMGFPSGDGGFDSAEANFDTFALTSTMASGPVLNCDAVQDDNLSISDIQAIILEVFGDPAALANGTPDCTANGGAVSISDIQAIILAVFG